MFDEDGTIIFDEWPIRPHDQIIDEFGSQFVTQFKSIYDIRASIAAGVVSEMDNLR